MVVFTLLTFRLFSEGCFWVLFGFITFGRKLRRQRLLAKVYLDRRAFKSVLGGKVRAPQAT